MKSKSISFKNFPSGNKRFFSFLLMLFFAFSFAQDKTGDFRSFATSGNWTANTTWQIYDGTTWNPAPAGVYPGVSGTNTYSVTISANTTVINGTAKTVSFGDLTVLGRLTLQADLTLASTQNIKIEGSGADIYYNANKVRFAVPVSVNLVIINGSAGLTSSGGGACNNNAEFWVGDIKYATCTGGSDTGYNFPQLATLGGLNITLDKNSICAGGTIVATASNPGASATNFVWTANALSSGGTTSGIVIATPNAVSTNVTFPTAGEYTVSFQYTLNGIKVRTSERIYVKATTVITQQPVSPGSYCANAPASILSVTATGAGNITYQWYRNTTNSTTNATLILNATSASYTTPAATNQTVYYFVKVSGECSSTNSNIVEVGVGAENVWNGSTWSKTSNSNMPGYTAVIRGPYNTAANGNINACNITVDPNYTFTIGSNSSATVQNAIVNNGELIVESDGNLKQINPVVNTTSIVVKRNFTLTDNRLEFIFLSSPVQGQNMFNIFGATQGAIPYVLKYNEATDYFVRTTDWSTPGLGYAVQEPARPTAQTPNSAVATYTGVPHNGTYTFTLPYTGQYYGFNVVGNPYPSNIDLLKLYAANVNNVDSDFKFWDKTVNNIYVQQGADYTQNAYAIYNASLNVGNVAPGYPTGAATTVGTKRPTNIVKVDQAFMIQAKQAGQIVFNNDIRTVENTGEFFGKEVGRDIFYLEMTTPAGTGMQNAIAYVPEVGTTAYGKEDSEVLGYNASDALYSILDDVNVVINGRGAFSADDVIKMGTAHFNKGSHTIRAIDLQGIFATGQAIYLKDKVTNIITDISKKAYTFDAAEGESNNRFEIVYQSEALATDNVAKGGLVVYKEGNSFFVRGGKKMRTVEVYDATGRMVKTSPATSDNLEIVADSFTRGLYVLKVKYDDGTVQTKKVLK